MDITSNMAMACFSIHLLSATVFLVFLSLQRIFAFSFPFYFSFWVQFFFGCGRARDLTSDNKLVDVKQWMNKKSTQNAWPQYKFTLTITRKFGKTKRISKKQTCLGGQIFFSSSVGERESGRALSFCLTPCFDDNSIK